MFAFATISGWVLLPMLATTISLPYLLRQPRVVQAFGGALRRKVHTGTLLQRLRPHYWLGYLIAGILLLHAFIAMSIGLARDASVAGLYLATAALLLVLGQLALGDALRSPNLSNRGTVRRVHFACMLTIVALAMGHVALNSPALHAIIH